MPNWRKVDENDLAATMSLREIDAFRRSGPVDGSDRVARLLERTVATVRGWISCNGSVRMGPLGTLPLSLISPAMDYAAFDLLKSKAAEINETRTKARQRAEEIFEKIATGAFTPESYSPDGEVSADDTRPAGSPAFGEAAPPRLLD